MTETPTRSTAFTLTAAFLALVLAVGGAGSRYPVMEMVVEGASIALICFLAVRFRQRAIAPPALFALALIGVVILIPALQLVPLPPSIWQELPGRQRAEEVLALIGRSDAYSPLSLDPEATKRSALALLPGIAMLVAVIHLTFHERLRLVKLVIVFAIIGVTLGALQIASGGGAAFMPFSTAHRDYGVGLFTNRNHQADFLLIAIAMTAATGRIVARDRPSSPVKLLAVGAIGLFAAGVLATASRTGAALLLLVLPLGVALLYPVRLRWRSVGTGVAVAAGAALVAINSSAVRTVLDRFAAPDDPRFAFWQDTLVAIRDHAPVGSGLGTFVPVHQSVESLSTVAPAYVNHAHNDYLQLALEGGAPALIALAGFAMFLGLAGWRLLKGKMDRSERVLGAAALLGIFVILLHSVVDYPLRMLSLEAVFGLLCGLLVSAPAALPEGVGVKPGQMTVRKGVRLAFCLAISAVLLVQFVILGLADQAVKGHVSPVAQRLAPWSADAASLSATDNLMAQNLDQAETLAVQALARSPLDVRAMSTLALVYELQGRGLDAARLMAVAASGGWRDLPTQLWLLGKAIELDDHDVAAQRADALLRQNQFQDRILPLLREMSLKPAAIAAIAQRLGDGPAWRNAFMHKLADLPPAQGAAHGALLYALAGTEAPPTDTEVAAYVATLLEARDYRRARATWLRLSRRDDRKSALLDAGGFEGIEGDNLDAPLTPFEWGQGNILDASVRVEQPVGASTGAALRVQARNGATGVLVKQLLVLEPGDYSLSFVAKADDAASGEGFIWSLECVDSLRVLPLAQAARSPANSGWIKVTSSFTVPADCAAQQLGLRASGLSPASLEAWFDDVGIVKRGTTP